MARERREFSVLGQGPFPFDMLRWESAFPATNGDSELLLRSITQIGGPIQEIRLVAHQEPGWKPDVAMWRSYGWDPIRFVAPAGAVRRSALGLWLVLALALVAGCSPEKGEAQRAPVTEWTGPAAPARLEVDENGRLGFAVTYGVLRDTKTGREFVWMSNSAGGLELLPLEPRQ